MFLRIIFYFTLFLLVSGCATTGGGASYSVGKNLSNDSSTESHDKLVPSAVVVVFDPNIPKSKDQMKSAGIWPELRRAEANRFSLMLKDALAKKRVFRNVRVHPDTSSSSNLYIQGKILKSNGENIDLEIKIVDITGKKIMNKRFTHRVDEYVLDDPRKQGQDIYNEAFDKIAIYIESKVKRLSSARIKELEAVEQIRFAEAFSEDYFSSYIKTSSRGVTKLITYPDDNDPMMAKIKPLYVKDQLFTDNLQDDYQIFFDKMNSDYLTWQKESFYQAKAERKARAEASAQALAGAFLMVAGAAAASNSNSSGGYNAGIVAAASGAGLLAKSAQTSREAKIIREGINELGKDLNIAITPNVIQMEDRLIEVTGDASEQYREWRRVLKEIYEKQETPQITL